MGINTQPYLNNLFVQIRNQHGWVEPICAITKVSQDKPQPSPAVIIHIKEKK